MKRPISPIALLSLLLFLVSLAAATGCKQGEGDVCQINSDCKDGLVCNAATMLCDSVGGDGDGDGD